MSHHWFATMLRHPNRCTKLIHATGALAATFGVRVAMTDVSSTGRATQDLPQGSASPSTVAATLADQMNPGRFANGHAVAGEPVGRLLEAMATRLASPSGDGQTGGHDYLLTELPVALLVTAGRRASADDAVPGRDQSRTARTIPLASVATIAALYVGSVCVLSVAFGPGRVVTDVPEQCYEMAVGLAVDRRCGWVGASTATRLEVRR
jgi:hypothetical protein